jgi:hypothetical protein
MAGSNQEAKTRQIANTNAPEMKKQCGKCPFAKEYNLVEKTIVLMEKEDKDGNRKVHSLSGYVKEGGNWLDGMLSILRQNGAVAEKIYLPGCGWGLSAAVLRDGAVIENPHGYFDGILPVAVIRGEKTELNFANIRIENQAVVLKDEAPPCPVGNSLVDTEGLVFKKGEYGELNPGSGMISWGRINQFGVPVQPFMERAPAYLLPQTVQELAIPNHFANLPQNPLVGAQRYDAVAFRRMGAGEDCPYPMQDNAGYALTAAVSASSGQESVAPQMAQSVGSVVQEIQVGIIRITEAGREPGRREEGKPAEGKPAISGMKNSPPAELPLHELKVELPAGKEYAPRAEGKPEERKEAAGKKDEPPRQNYVKRAGIPVDSAPFTHDARAPKPGMRVDFSNWKAWLPEMPRRMKRGKAKKDEPPKESVREKRAPKDARKGRRKIISGRIGPGDAKEVPTQKKERGQKVLAKEMKAAKAKRAKENRGKRFREELRIRKTRREKPAAIAAAGKKRGDYAEKYLLMKKAKARKKRNWLSISKR